MTYISLDSERATKCQKVSHRFLQSPLHPSSSSQRSVSAFDLFCQLLSTPEPSTPPTTSHSRSSLPTTSFNFTHPHISSAPHNKLPRAFEFGPVSPSTSALISAGPSPPIKPSTFDFFNLLPTTPKPSTPPQSQPTAFDLFNTLPTHTPSTSDRYQSQPTAFNLFNALPSSPSPPTPIHQSTPTAFDLFNALPLSPPPPHTPINHRSPSPQPPPLLSTYIDLTNDDAMLVSPRLPSTSAILNLTNDANDANDDHMSEDEDSTVFNPVGRRQERFWVDGSATLSHEHRHAEQVDVDRQLPTALHEAGFPQFVSSFFIH